MSAALARLDQAYYATQPGVDGPTARGVRVRAGDIEGCAEGEPPAWMWEEVGFQPDDDPSTKGRKAVQMVVLMLLHRWPPFHPRISGWREVGHLGCGYDMLVEAPSEDVLGLREFKLEVKCDYPGTWSGLFLQLAERNPLGRH